MTVILRVRLINTYFEVVVNERGKYSVRSNFCQMNMVVSVPRSDRELTMWCGVIVDDIASKSGTLTDHWRHARGLEHAYFL